MTMFQKLLFAGLLVLTLYAFWPRDADQVPAMQQWQMSVDQSGTTRFMGLVLGESAFVDAQLRFDDAGEVAVFVGKKGSGKEAPQLEVFFDDLPDNGRLILNLEAAPELIGKIIKEGYQPIILPDGTKKIRVSPAYAKDVRRLKIASLTFLPPVRLDRKSFETLFGPAEADIGTGDGSLHLLYPNLGLDFIRSEEGVDILQLVPLNEYEALVAPLKKALAEQMAKQAAEQGASQKNAEPQQP